MSGISSGRSIDLKEEIAPDLLEYKRAQGALRTLIWALTHSLDATKEGLVAHSTVNGKRCPKCSIERPVSDWNKNRNRSDGLAVWCKTCQSAYSREWRARPEVKERAASRAAERYASMSDQERAAYIVAGTARRRATGYNLASKYGITIEQYEQLLESQGGGCAICAAPEPSNRRLAVDHDHACCPSEKTCGNCIRGLLCITCNVWLGFYESKKWTDRAKAYLDREIARMEKGGEA